MRGKAKKKLGWGVAILAVVALVIVFTFVGGSSGPSDAFAQCLTDNNVKMYGAYWCPHCQNQKRAFGDSWSFVDYTECAVPGGQGQSQECTQAGVQSYPTWEFADGTRQTGELSFQRLSELSGCSLDLLQQTETDS